MAHEVETMMYVGERPWHGLGKALENAPTIEEGIKEAGLDWEVKLNTMSTRVGGEYVKIPNKKAVIRSSDNSVLGIVGDNYKPVQNIEAFNFFQPFLDNDMATLETAGSLLNGKRVFVLAKLKSDNMVIQKDDEVEKYILLSNSHDGSQALRVGFVPIRVVCQNTLNFAENHKASQLIRVRHQGDIIQTLDELRETMDLVNKQFIATEEQYQYLATKQVNVNDLHKYVKEVFTRKQKQELENIVTDYEEKEEIEKFRKRLMSRVEEVFEMEPAKNAWTMYNAVNYYFNHDKGKTLESTYNSLWFGSSKRLDRKAFDLALKY